MKLNRLFIALASLVTLSLVACEEYEDNYKKADNVPAGCSGLRFANVDKSSFEFDPSGDLSFPVTIMRDATDAAEYSVNVVKNDSEGFIVPAKVSFASGEKVKDIVVTMSSNAPQGKDLQLTLSVDDSEINPYKTEYGVYTASAMIVKWDNIGYGYLVDGTIGSLWGVDTSLAYRIELQKAVISADETRYRFSSPWATMNPEEEVDELGGFIGYVYNEDGYFDADGEYLIVMSVDGKGNVTMNSSETGMDWGYGMHTIGTVCPNLSSNTESYPLGTFKDDVITFGAKSLFLSAPNPDLGTQVCSVATTIYLSSAAFAASQETEDEEEEEEDPYEGWTAIGTGTYTYTVLYIDENEEPVDDEGLTLYQNNEDKSLYMIGAWGENSNLVFSVDENNIVTVKEQPTGSVAYGEDVLAATVTDFASDAIPSFYSESEGTYYFNIEYYIPDMGSFGYDIEYFVLDSDDAEEGENKSVKASSKSVKKELKRFKNIKPLARAAR